MYVSMLGDVYMPDKQFALLANNSGNWVVRRGLSKETFWRALAFDDKTTGKKPE